MGSFPFWSPDSRFIGFFADGKLKKVHVTGGPPVVVRDAPFGQGGTWNRDNVIVFAPSAIGTPLMRVSAGGASAAPITTLDKTYGETNHRYPFSAGRPSFPVHCGDRHRWRRAKTVEDQNRRARFARHFGPHRRGVLRGVRVGASGLPARYDADGAAVRSQLAPARRRSCPSRNKSAPSRVGTAVSRFRKVACSFTPKAVRRRPPRPRD